MPSAEDAGQATENDAARAGGLNFASIGQIYETTIRADGVPPMRFVSVPRRALDPKATDSEVALSVEEFRRIFDFRAPADRQFSPSALPFVLLQCLIGELFARDPLPNEVALYVGDMAGEQRRLIEFAEYLASEDLIPFELPDQQSHSLAKINLTDAMTGMGLGAAGDDAKSGAADGFAIDAPGGPLVFITVPAGFVVGGLVSALTEALGEKLYDRLRAPRRPKPS